MKKSTKRLAHFFAVSGRVLFSVGILGFIGVIGICGAAFAQSSYPGWKMSDKTAEDGKKISKDITAALQAGTVNRAQFDPYFKEYYFHRWTNPKNSSDLKTYVRDELLRNDLDKATGQARTYLLKATEAALKIMKSDEKVYPAARVNAVIALGLMYEDESKTKLYQPALPLLIDELKSKKAPDANKLEALNGIIRFVNTGIDNAQLRDTEVTQILTKIAIDKTVPSGRTQDVHDYFFRTRAIEGLGALCRTAPKKEVVDTLLSIIEDKNDLDMLRYLAVRAIAEINYTNAADAGVTLDLKQIYFVLSTFAREICSLESKNVEAIRRSEQVRTTGGAGGMGGMGGSMGGMSGPGMSGSMGGDTGGGMMGAMSPTGGGGGLSGSSSEKTIERIKLAISRSKFAFGAIKDAFGSERKPDSFVSAVAKQNTPESKDDVAAINGIVKLVDDYFKFLNNGPATTATTRRPRQNTTAGGGMPSTLGAARPLGPNAPKVTLLDILDELEDLTSKFNDLLEAGGATAAKTTTTKTTPDTETVPATESNDVIIEF
ncbi:MAG: HEAT repeat domain-containing protein [Thermoguttaceae bacterium]